MPTLNSVGTNSKNNHKYRGWKKAWEEHFGEWLKSLPPATQQRRVTITRYYGKGKRAYDSQNFAGGCKSLLDTLTNFGALYDDSDLWCEAHHLQVRAPDGIDAVEVRIEEISP